MKILGHKAYLFENSRANVKKLALCAGFSVPGWGGRKGRQSPYRAPAKVADTHAESLVAPCD
jgi:hypothetical protein